MTREVSHDDLNRIYDEIKGVRADLARYREECAAHKVQTSQLDDRSRSSQALLTGNGDPHQGIVVRIDRLERMSRIQVALASVLLAALVTWIGNQWWIQTHVPDSARPPATIMSPAPAGAPGTQVH